MRSIRDAQSRIGEELETHKRYRDRLTEELCLINDAEAAAIKGDMDKIAYLTSQLEAHLLNKRAVDPSVKSIKTPWGEVSSRLQGPEFKREDNLVLHWAERYNFTTLVREKTTREINWEGIRMLCHVRDDNLVTPDGEVVPGVTVFERPLKVTVKCEP